MMKVCPHYWMDDGSWEFDANEWKDDAEFFEIPDDVVENYKRAQRNLEAASAAVREALDAAGYER